MCHAQGTPPEIWLIFFFYGQKIKKIKIKNKKKLIFEILWNFSGFSNFLTIFDNFRIFWVFLWTFLIFVGLFYFLLDFFWIFLDYFGFLDFFNFLDFFLIFSFFWFLSKLIRLLLNVTMVTTGHQKLPKMGQPSIKSSFFARRAKKALAEALRGS